MFDPHHDDLSKLLIQYENGISTKLANTEKASMSRTLNSARKVPTAQDLVERMMAYESAITLNSARKVPTAQDLVKRMMANKFAITNNRPEIDMMRLRMRMGYRAQQEQRQAIVQQQHRQAIAQQQQAAQKRQQAEKSRQRGVSLKTALLTTVGVAMFSLFGQNKEFTSAVGKTIDNAKHAVHAPGRLVTGGLQKLTK